MKKILIALSILVSVNSFSQEIVTLSIKARLVQTLAPFVRGNDDTAFINLYDRWKKKYEVANPPNNTTQVSVDSVSIRVIAACYSKVCSWPQGASSVGDDFKADVAALRAGNATLDGLLDAIDQAFSAELAEQRLKGRRLLTGKNN